MENNAAAPTAEIQGDGSMMDAINSMPDIEALEQERAPRPSPRTEPEPELKAKSPVEKVTPEKAVEAKANDKAPVPDAEATEDDSDYIELPPEAEGKEATRLKLDDVLTGYRKSQDLEKELVEARSNYKIMPPPEVETAMANALHERMNYAKAARDMLARSQPIAPDFTLTNPSSPNFNPELFHLQWNQFQQQNAATEADKSRIAALDAENNQMQTELLRGRQSRERDLLVKAWPELKGKGEMDKVREGIKKAYGFSDEEINATLDHRNFLVIKDALAYREGLSKTAEIVKAVKAKPTLVKGNARVSSNTKAARFSDSYSRLQSSGSLDDAANALDGLL